MKKLAALIVLICAMSVVCLAQDGIDTGGLMEGLGENGSAIGEMTPENGNVKSGAKGLLEKGLEQLKAQLKKSVGSGFLILSACALASIALAFCKNAGIALPEKALELALICTILAITFSPMGSLLNQCKASITHLDSFSKVLMPVFAAACAVSGSPISAVASAGAALLFSNILLDTVLKIFVPLIYGYIIAVAAGAMCESELLLRGAGAFKSMANSLCKGLLMVFVAYITLSGITTSGADAMAVRTARVTISGVVPVLGTVIADASDTILSGAAMLRANIGVFGCLGACAICLVPFVSALTHLFMFRAVAAVACSFSCGAASKLIDGLCEAYKTALGLLSACCAVQFIAIIVSSVVCRR